MIMEMSEYYKELAKNMRIERARLNISQLKLAEMADVSLDTINLIERGVGNPKLCTIIAIAKALNVDLNTLVKV
jgi:transcriptional regulator with XRE-family HTH domain